MKPALILGLAVFLGQASSKRVTFGINKMSKQEAIALNGGQPITLGAARKYDIPLHSGNLPDDWLYYGTFYVGSTPDKVNLLFTSLTDWTVIAAYNCANCDNKQYNYEVSETNKRGQGNVFYSEKSWLEVDGFNLTGFSSRDTICSERRGGECIGSPGPEFFTVTSDPQKFLGLFSGVIGLIPASDAPLSPGDTSLIAYLRGRGYTDNSQVSVLLRDGDANQSSVIFGGYDETLLYPDKDGKFVLLPMKVKDGTMHIENVATYIGNSSLSNDTRVQVDSFFPGILLPKGQWDIF